MPEFQDRVLKCVDCGADFVFTAGEQHFFHDKNFKNEPKRCKACKTKRQGSRAGSGFAKTKP
jgi:5,10-methylenetetrahydrofolate reductase